LQSEVAALGLLVCEAEYLEPETAAEPPDALCRGVMSELVERIGAERFPGTIELDDAQWISWRLGELLPLSTGLRQQLLETNSATARLATLRDVLVAAGMEQSP
jgi:Lon protease-like protein